MKFHPSCRACTLSSSGFREREDFSLWEKPEDAGLDLVDYALMVHPSACKEDMSNDSGGLSKLQTSVNALEFVILDWGLMFNINSGLWGLVVQRKHVGK
ncbi:hypothetical protein NC652_005738 [Populus alba x Populus x berolinensis]|nr:hypothetical protein NC652_005738 [Populus alba x Populus x berolinensis]